MEDSRIPHQCPEGRAFYLGLNDYPVDDDRRHGPCGPAVEQILQDAEGRWWAGNGEYQTQVNYCPFCGRAAPTTTRPTARQWEKMNY